MGSCIIFLRNMKRGAFAYNNQLNLDSLYKVHDDRKQNIHKTSKCHKQLVIERQEAANSSV